MTRRVLLRLPHDVEGQPRLSDKPDVVGYRLRLTGHNDNLEVRKFDARSLGELDAVLRLGKFISEQNRDGIVIHDPLGRFRTLALNDPNMFVLKQVAYHCSLKRVVLDDERQGTSGVDWPMGILPGSCPKGELSDL